VKLDGRNTRAGSAEIEAVAVTALGLSYAQIDAILECNCTVDTALHRRQS